MIMRKSVYIAVSVILLGCGGAEDVVLQGPPPDPRTGGGAGGGAGPSSGSLACALTGCEIAKLLVTPVMPSGQAVYLGRLSYATENAAGVIKTTNANLNMTANFNTGNIALELSNFNDGLRYSGTALGAATITNAQFSGSYSGNLTQNGTEKSVSGAVTGQFRGSLAQALDGEVIATGEGGTGGDAFGRFFANRQ